MVNKIISNQPYSIYAYWEKLIKNSYLIKVLTRRELKVKYNRTFFGIGWVILQPLIVVAVYTVFLIISSSSTQMRFRIHSLF